MVLSVARQTAQVLAFAHAAGMVHRDIKPANLMRLPDGRVKVCDFGLSRFADDTLGLITEGQFVGTREYMAPELFHGAKANPQTDLYSLGCTLYALLTNHMLLPGADPAPRPLRPATPPTLANLVIDLLAADPTKRPTSATAVNHRLEHNPPQAPPNTADLYAPAGA